MPWNVKVLLILAFIGLVLLVLYAVFLESQKARKSSNITAVFLIVDEESGAE